MSMYVYTYPTEDMDEESRAAFQQMFDTLLDSCELGLPRARRWGLLRVALHTRGLLE